jgi:hypothetical protein
MTHTVYVYRIDTGARIAHLDRTFDTASEARSYALAANCKAFTPFYFIAREAAA